LAAKRARGERLGKAPEIDPETEARIVAERLRGQTMPSIALGLNADGTPTARGGSSHASTVANVLARHQVA
jgi:hypothetical protein